MFIEQIIHSHGPKIENPKNAMDNYLRIGVLAINDVASYIHARRRSDMKEVYIWLYKMPLRQLSEKEHFTNTLVQYSKLKNSPLLSYGVDQNGYAYVVTDKIKLFSINNSRPSILHLRYI